jgi:hypothetical protein
VGVDINISTAVQRGPLRLVLEEAHGLDVLHVQKLVSL